MSYSLQSQEGLELNRLYHEDQSVHDWYRFVLSFPPHLVRKYLSLFNIRKGDLVFDPFCGTGTTLVECKKYGVASVGSEAIPIVRLAAKCKTAWSINPHDLIRHASKIAVETEKRLTTHSSDLLTLSKEKQNLLIKNSIEPIPLHKCLMLLNVIDELKDDNFFDIEHLAIAKHVVHSYSNLHFGPEVGVKRKRRIDAPVIDLWLLQIKKIAHDLILNSVNAYVPTTVHLADARFLLDSIPYKSIDAVITSPPYPNEKDYTRTTRLESVLLGTLNSKSDLRRLKNNLIRSNTRNVFAADIDNQWVASNSEIQQLCEIIEVERQRLSKTSGFERLYHKVVSHYFGGMAKHLQSIKPLLKNGASLAYVVGQQASYFRVQIRTGNILANIASALGYEVIDIELFRNRISTATKKYLPEEVIILKWTGSNNV